MMDLTHLTKFNQKLSFWTTDLFNFLICNCNNIDVVRGFKYHKNTIIWIQIAFIRAEINIYNICYFLFFLFFLLLMTEKLKLGENESIQ